MPAKISKPNSFFVRGRDLVLNEYTDPGSVGEIPMFIHQTWKNDMMKQDYVNSFDNWSRLHPGFVHVLWTDEDNDLLVSTWFPQYLDSYKWLPIIIQKTDFVRLMYLYKYGGIYADMDYVAYQPLPLCLPQLCGFMAVQSPFSLNENLQNSLMVSSPGHPVVLEALEIINETVKDLRARKKYPGFNLKSKLVGPILATFLTLSLTGPQVLDKAVSRVATSEQQSRVAPPEQKNTRADTSIVYLDDSFFKGPVAAHLQHSTWMQTLPKKCVPIIILAVFTFLVVIAIVVLVTYYAGQRHKH